MRARLFLPPALLALLLSGCALLPPVGPGAATPPAPPLADLAMLLGDAPRSRAPADDVLRVVERRCVVCHGCYDAPCQLKLTSPDGLVRGGSKADPYDTERLHDAPPTRLGIDATTEAGWRGLGFHPVAAPGRPDEAGASVIARILALGRVAPPVPDAALPEAVSLDRDRALTCPAPDEFAAFAAAMPLSGMPYGMAPLPDDEFATLGRWVLSGAPLPGHAAAPSPAAAREIAEWERFLNDPDPRRALVARYMYEHLFLAHLHIEGDAPDRFHRLIRSAPGEPAREIPTVRPFDDPGAGFVYRIVPINETILHKDHLVYEIGPERRARVRALFLAPAWTAGPAPAWGARAGGDPFVTFAAIPAASRYRFLLDDALFFVRSFIRGPVCRGQVATDVIEDRFWVAFLDPSADLSLTDPELLARGAALLKLPVSTADESAFRQLLPALHDGESAWLTLRDARYARSPAHAAGFALSDIWDGDGTNEQALLTVFRNYDNATAVSGFIGATPKTAWVMDYPVFERLYYDLVAGYDVFSDLETQLTTRLYMDHLRRESEDLFLSFLPPDTRKAEHAYWYRGALSELHASWAERRRLDGGPTAVTFTTSDPKAELLAALPARNPGLWATDDPINRCDGPGCAGLAPVERTLAGLTGEEGPWVRFLPDLSLLRVTGGKGGAQVFTLFHDKALKNVALIFDEAGRREPEHDRVTVMAGQAASYPNFFFEVTADAAPAFVADLMAMRAPDDWLAVVARYGVRRASPRFWQVADAMNDDMLAQDRLQGGLLDLNRYDDPKPGEPALR